MNDDEAQLVVNLLESLDNKSTIDEVVKAFETLVEFAQQVKEFNLEERGAIMSTLDEAVASAEERLAGYNEDEWVKIRKIVSEIKNGKDGKDGRNGRDGRDGVDGKSGVNGKDGIDGVDGQDGQNGTDGVDLFPNTPNEEVDKINEATNQIKKERVQGLADIERLASMNVQSPAPRQMIYRNGVQVGQARNVNFNNSIVSIQDDRATITPIYVSTTAPTNPQVNDLWLDIN